MATGFLVSSMCYESLATATDVYFSSQPVVSFPDPVNPLVHQIVKFELVNGVWMRSVYGSAPWGDTLWSSTVAIPPVLPPCLSPSEWYFSGVEFGAAICALLVISFGFRAIKRVL